MTRNGENTATYTYDVIGQVLGDVASEGTTNRMNEQLHYAFDPASNLNYRTNNTLIENFQVNTVNELTENTNGGKLTVMGTTTSAATNVAVNGTNALRYGDATFAATNMPLTTTYTATASDSYGRYSTNTVTVSIATNTTYQYDGNGNLTSDGLRSFAYDDENQLIQVWMTNQWLSQFSYDGKMRRRIRQEFTWQSGQWVQTNEVYYVYDGNVVIQERSANNMPTTTYTRGLDLSSGLQNAGGIGGLLAMTLNTSPGPSSSNSYYYHSDGNGNVTMLINGSQAIVAKYLYDAFGNVLSAAGSLAQANLYRFSSKETHINSGLVYYLYRFYDPNLQRWPSRDPITESGGINLYCFAANDPVIGGDYYGLAGGPWHPPSGVSLSCDPSDSCGQLTAKMSILQKMIASHVGWDRNMPSLRGGGRHAVEIADLWRAYARCQALHAAKNCQDYEPPSVWRRIICKVPGSDETWNNIAVGSVAVAVAASGGALGIAAAGTAGPILVLAPAAGL